MRVLSSDDMNPEQSSYLYNSKLAHLHYFPMHNSWVSSSGFDGRPLYTSQYCVVFDLPVCMYCNQFGSFVPVGSEMPHAAQSDAAQLKPISTDNEAAEIDGEINAVRNEDFAGAGAASAQMPLRSY